MIKRNSYLQQLLDYVDKPFIKIITGIRRSGKSTLLQLLKEELLNRNVAEDHILLINLESFRHVSIQSAADLYTEIETFSTGKKRIYVLLDEIQEIKSWEKAVNAIRLDIDADIYITGSNSHLLSSELSTLLTGRYVEIPVYPLSFSECQTLERECASLLGVKDHYPKYLLTMDYQFRDSVEGIKIMSIPDFLLGDVN